MSVPHSVDVIVLGTGAAGLTAAITAHEHGASVAVFEKADQVGGTSAWSGGMLWLPANPVAADAGVEDTREEGLTYLNGLSNGTIDPELAAAFIDGGNEMLQFMQEHTPVVFRLCHGFPDYHAEHPGGKTGGGRSLECPPFPYGELGEWAGRVTVGRFIPKQYSISESPVGRGEGLSPAEYERRTVEDERGSGLALIGRLLKGCLDRGIEPHTGMRAIQLVMDEGRIAGVRFEDPAVTVRAKAVVLATGGFEWNPELVKAFLRGPLDNSVTVPTNTGDGLKMAMRVGASLGNMREAWWTPSMDLPDEDGNLLAAFAQGEKNRPHSIMVNRAGKRFANEAANYNTFGGAFHQIDLDRYDYANLPCWIVFDHHYLTKYGLHTYRGEGPVPDWITSADTLPGLASELGIPADALVATVERFNTFAADGDDLDFFRGRGANDIWWADPELTGKIESTLGPLDTPPFYAVEAKSGTLGTKGGPRTDVNGQVIDLDGELIPGLYAAGNVMASALGMTYGGAGGTLGPGMAFGFLAGRHAALPSDHPRG